jgi:hypothetical protein
MSGAERSADILADDEWIKREWLKIIAEYSPEGTYNAEKNHDSIFVICLSILICLK